MEANGVKKESSYWWPVDLRASPTDRSNLIGMECECVKSAEMDRVIKAVALQMICFLQRNKNRTVSADQNYNTVFPTTGFTFLVLVDAQISRQSQISIEQEMYTNVTYTNTIK